MYIKPLKHIKSRDGVEVIQALTPNGVTVVKRSIVTPDGEVDSGMMREIEIFRRLSQNSIEVSLYTDSIIRPLGIYIWSPAPDATNLSLSSGDIGSSSNRGVSYLCIEMVRAAGDIFDLTRFRGADELDSELKLGILKTAVGGLIVLHLMGYCYTDLKPDNILYHTNDMGNTNFQLIDFDNVFHHTQKYRAKYGTPSTMSPELVELVDGTMGEEFDYQKSDYWSIGALCFYLLTGNTPIQADTIDSFREEIQRFDLNDLMDPINQAESQSETQAVFDNDVRSLLVSIINSTLLIDPSERTFDPHQELNKINSLLGVDNLMADTNDQIAEEEIETNDNSDNSDNSDDSIEHILCDIVQPFVQESDIPNDQVERVTDEIIKRSTALVAQNLSGLLKLYPTVFEDPESGDIDLAYHYRNLWCILSLNYVMRICLDPKHIGIPTPEYLYSMMGEYYIFEKTYENSEILENLTHQMIASRPLIHLINMDLQKIKIDSAIP